MLTEILIAGVENVMRVRTKMRCDAIELNADGSGGSVSLSPVIGGSPENDEFFRFTPSGRLVLSTINAVAFRQFELGKEFYVDISAVEPAEPARETEVLTADDCGELKPE